MPHDHDHDHDHPHGHGHHHHHGGHGHNAAPRVAQWQTPHAPDEAPVTRGPEPEADFDLVEAAFAAAFPGAGDATSFLRLAGVPFVGTGADGARLYLLRVEQSEATDIGSVTPGLGGGGARYAPMPKRLVSRRRDLAFLYFDGAATRRLTLGEARMLTDQSLEDASARIVAAD